MDAKEKANELVEKYKLKCGGYWGGKMNKEFAKQSAIIAVDEILGTIDAEYYHVILYNYWQEVKSELQSL